MDDKEIIKLISKAIVSGQLVHENWEIPYPLSSEIVNMFGGDISKFFDIITKHESYLSVIGVKLDFWPAGDLHSIYYNGHEVNYWDFGWY